MFHYQVNSRLMNSIREDFPNWKIKVDKNINIYAETIDKIANRRKTISIRYVPGEIRIPVASWLPCFKKRRYYNKRSYHSIMEVSSLVIKRFDELTDNDAVKDGLVDKQTLVSILKDMNPEIDSNELLSIYKIRKIT